MPNTNAETFSTSQRNQAWFDRHAPKMGECWHAFHDAVQERGVLDAKTKELISVASASLDRCPHCTRSHIKATQRAGATPADITEAMMVSALIASGTEIHWMLEDYEKLLVGNGDGPWFEQRAPESGKPWREFHDAIYEDSELDRKTKELIAVAAGTIGRCAHCTRSHIEAAQEHGASKEEISEALMIAALQGSGTQLMWHKEAFEELLRR
jgi:AhpD family alkylhydroperoxidase